MRKLLYILFPLFVSCQSQQRLTVYADPWLGDYTKELVQEWQAGHPEVQVDLRLLSSEVIAQHLHYGQPIDLVFAFGMEIFEEKGIEVAGSVPLADTRIVEVVRGETAQQAAFGTEECVVVAASDRPLRRYTEAWGQHRDAPCAVYADFYRQTRDYLVRGWVPKGYVPEVLARQYPEFLTIKAKGPIIPEAFTAFVPKDARHSEVASVVLHFTTSEKSKELLAKMHLID